ncbi:MAG: hypothetical protein CR986_05255 [Ignavibacteriae bacterium]|nr:MAG: hypothetical protein CR986_05255 [Ignavibacteriota bacterium]
MLQFLAVILVMIFAVGIFWGGLYFSKYKQKPNSGCCGGGHCDSGGNQHSCYSSKADFVKNIDKLKVEKLEDRN